MKILIGDKISKADRDDYMQSYIKVVVTVISHYRICLKIYYIFRSALYHGGTDICYIYIFVYIPY